MIEAVKFWNEPNNLSHWDFQLDPQCYAFTQMIAGRPKLAAIPASGSPPVGIIMVGLKPKSLSLQA